MNIEKIKQYMTDSHYLTYNKNLVYNLGHIEAMIYTELVVRANNYKYSKKGNLLQKDGSFFCTIDDLEYECSVGQKGQLRMLKDLQARGLIEVYYRGLPKRRYIKVLEDDFSVKRAFENNRVVKEKTPLPEELKKLKEDYNEAMQETHKEESVANLETPENPSITKGKAIIDDMMIKEAENKPQTSETIVDDAITPIEDFTFNIEDYSKTYHRVATEKGIDNMTLVLKEFSEMLYETVPPAHPISRNAIEKSIKAFKNSTYVKEYLLETNDGVEELDKEVARVIISEFAKSTAKDKTMNLLLSDKWIGKFCERYRCNEA